MFLSFLPLSHAFERSIDKLAEDMKTVRPTILVSVPRIYERVYAKLQALLAGSALKMWLFGAAQAVGWRRFCRAQQLPVEATCPRSPMHSRGRCSSG